jgi:hypothetical protein
LVKIACKKTNKKADILGLKYEGKSGKPGNHSQRHGAAARQVIKSQILLYQYKKSQLFPIGTNNCLFFLTIWL